MKLNNLIGIERDDIAFLYASRVVIDYLKNRIDVEIDKDKCIVNMYKNELDLPSIDEIRHENPLIVKTPYKVEIEGRILLSSGVITIINNKLLLLQRDAQAKYDPLKWTMPAGRCDRDIEFTAIKEYFEEVFFTDKKGKAVALVPKCKNKIRSTTLNIYKNTLAKNGVDKKNFKKYRAVSRSSKFIDEMVLVLTARSNDRYEKIEIFRSKMFVMLDEKYNTLEFRKVIIFRNRKLENIRCWDGEYNRKVALFPFNAICKIDDESLVSSVVTIRNYYIKSKNC